MAEPVPASLDATPYRVSEAEKAHERGWVLTPTRGKRPILKEWQKRAAPDLPIWLANDVGDIVSRQLANLFPSGFDSKEVKRTL